MRNASAITPRLSRRLEALEVVVRGLVSEIRDIRVELEAAQEEGDWEEVSRVEPEPTPVPAAAPCARRGADSPEVRNRFYTVLVARGASDSGRVPAGLVGVFNRYGAYVNQVCREDTYPHTGRGHINFDRESESRAFPTVSAAESYWLSRYPDTPVIRHW